MAERSKTIKDNAKSFAENGAFKSTDTSFNNLLKDTADQRIKVHKKKIKAYEAKYGSFKEFTKNISGKATIKQEDQWMEWEAAINLLKAWKLVSKELDSNAAK